MHIAVRGSVVLAVASVFALCMHGRYEPAAQASPPSPVQAAQARGGQEGAAPCGCHGGAGEEEQPSQEVVAVDVGGAPILGAPDAPVTVVVFSDLQCPFCARLDVRLRAIEARRHGQVRIAFKHMPLPFHARATSAARAAVAADDGGRFWEYIEHVFASPSALADADLVGYARELGLDAARFEAIMNEPGTAARVQQDVEQAQRLEIHGTPTLFVQGRRVQGLRDEATIERMIDDALSRRQ
jgi:protein-disulfide isomerase